MHQNSEKVISDTIFNCFQDQKITGNKDEKLKSRWDKVFKKGTSKVFERLSSTYFTWNTMIHCSLQILYFVQ